MEQYMKPNWIAVTFESKWQNWRLIPSLFLFDGESHGLLSTHAVKDLVEYPSLEVCSCGKARNTLSGVRGKVRGWE